MLRSLNTLRRRCLGSRDGTTSIEFAFAVPVMVMVTYGIMEVARLLYTQGVLIYAAEEATRYATVHYEESVSQIQSVAESHFVMIDPARISLFSVTAPVDPDDQTKLVTVQINYSFKLLVPFTDHPLVTLSASSRGFLTEEV